MMIPFIRLTCLLLLCTFTAIKTKIIIIKPAADPAKTPISSTFDDSGEDSE